jgi:hypothetical protein
MLLEDQAAIDKAAHWVLGHPDLFLLAVGAMQLLPRVLGAPTRFAARPADTEMAALVDASDIRPVFS